MMTKELLCLLILLLISLIHSEEKQEYVYNESNRITHAFINGEVRLNESFGIGVDNHCQLIIQLQYSRDDHDRTRSIAQVKLRLNQTQMRQRPFRVQFQLKYPVEKITPHNTHILSAQIRNQRKKLLYLGDLGLPITEKQEKQAKFLIIHLVPTPSWYKNIKKLSPLAYKVTQLGGTEESFTSEYYTNKKPGVYNCIVCNSTLFSSKHKYESGTGWPSFYETATKVSVETNIDRKFGLTRTEVHCGKCKAHLGHVFDDGPRPTYLRYCINGVTLQFYSDHHET